MDLHTEWNQQVGGIARGHLASECRQERGVTCDEALGPEVETAEETEGAVRSVKYRCWEGDGMFPCSHFLFFFVWFFCSLYHTF